MYLLEGVIMILLFRVLFYQGVFLQIGEHVVITQPFHEEYTDFRGRVLEEGEKTAPGICYLGGTCSIGVLKLGELILASDYEGKELSFQIKQIQNPLGESVLTELDKEAMELYVREPGIYQVHVVAIDDGNRITKGVIRIPVN